MILRTITFFVPLALGVAFASRGPGAYERDIDQPVASVLGRLSRADIRDQPGSPGTDPGRAGGVQPLIRTTRTTDSVRWTVMSGQEVATTMIATVTPAEGGRGSHVVASVEPGDADPDMVSPAFRSKATTQALLTAMVESELNEMTADASRGPRQGRRFSDGVRAVAQVHAGYNDYLRTGNDPFRAEVEELEARLEKARYDREQAKFKPGKPQLDLSEYR